MTALTGAGPAALAVLEARIAHGRECLIDRFDDWVPPAKGRDCDVVIVGGGQSGLAAAFGLMRMGINRVRVLDAATAGGEGPWVRFARMLTLRSPKWLWGPELGIPDLSFRAWCEAAHGPAFYAAIAKIPKDLWMDYLVWFRRVVGVTVENEATVRGIEPDAGGLRVAVTRGGLEQWLATRKVVLATGMDGCGKPALPAQLTAGLAPGTFAHTLDAIDFPALKGRRVAVLGAASSAFDNASTALEHGAAEVRLYCRHTTIARHNPNMSLVYPGSLQAFSDLDDGLRWEVMRHVFARASAPTRETLNRAVRQPGFRLVLGAPWQRLAAQDEGIAITTPAGTWSADFVIFGTGFAPDLASRPELATCADLIALWRDRYHPPPALASEAVGAYPYLGPGYEFLERTPATAAWLRDVHCFNYGATPSHGISVGGNPAMRFGVPRLVHAIVRDFMRADVEHHRRRMMSPPEPELDEGEWLGPWASAG
ncbi:MAG: NAD(P)/FAD-dependent oxidoreductase [Alphaproteobacteria bacterium]|nr:NAD(P)/FAD-dependent oxidoreductase [Alphaproteobacteria bacterium]